MPVVSKIRGIFSKKTSNTDVTGTGVLPADENPLVKAAKGSEAADAPAPLSADEQAALSGCGHSCSSCAEKRATFDSRHVILGGSLLSAAVFGFPVFCLICPVGLSVATFIALWRLLQFSEATLSLVVFPVILVAEIVLLRKWCHRFCPLGALLGLMARLNRTFRPTVAAESCLHCSGASCSRCADVCPEGIDLHHPEASVSLAECTKCGECRDACPAHAISFPLLARTEKAGLPVASAAQEADEDAVGAEG